MNHLDSKAQKVKLNPNSIDVETKLLLLKLTANMYDRNAINFSKKETKFLLDFFEPMSSDDTKHRPKQKQEAQAFWFAFLKSISQVAALCNYLMTREPTVMRTLNK